MAPKMVSAAERLLMGSEWGGQMMLTLHSYGWKDVTRHGAGTWAQRNIYSSKQNAELK